MKHAFALLNPIIRGWANYFRTVVASETFSGLDSWMFRRAVRYVNRTHPKKPNSWRKQRYWGKLNSKSNSSWVFGDKRTGRYLLRFSDFRIVRHVLVRGASSPDDPSLRDYWWARQKVNARHLTPSDLKLAEAQTWCCRVCGMSLFNGEEIPTLPQATKGDGRHGCVQQPGTRSPLLPSAIRHRPPERTD